MLLWLKNHSKTLNFFGGILILITTALFYFWTTTKLVAVSQGGKTAQEKRIERSLLHSNIIVRENKKKRDISAVSKKLKESKQAENFLLFLMLLGSGMVLYSLYTKYKEQRAGL